MIPKGAAEALALSYTEMPCKTHALDLKQQRVHGYADRLEAVRQAVYLILNTERYTYPIYSRGYGAELGGLIGMPIPFVLPEIKRRITEALLMDERITGVDSWEFETQRHSVRANFVVHTVYGDINTSREVDI